MGCSSYSADLTAYLDEELNSRRRRDLEEHLLGCEGCAADLDGLRAAAGLVQSNLRELEPSGNIWRQVESRIAALPAGAAPFPARLRQFPSWGWAGAAAVFLLAAGIGVRGYLARQAGEEDLRQYMTLYIQSREAERERRLEASSTKAADAGASAAVALASDENPFSAPTDSSNDNPFRSEEQ